MKRGFKKSIFGGVTLLITAVLGFSQVGMAMDYPYKDPYLATLTVRLMKSRTNAGKPISVSALPGREATPIVGNRARQLTATTFPVQGAAKVLFLIPGTGGSDTEGAAAYLAEEFNAAGLHVIIVPSPMNWKMNLAASENALAGDPKADAADLYRVMQDAWQKAKSQMGIKATGFAVAGYSLGALNAFFVDQIDKSQGAFKFSQVLLMYPPTNVGKAIAKMDQLNSIGDSWSGSAKTSLWGYVFNVGSGLISRDINKPDYFMDLDKKIQISRDQVGYLIGNSFRQTLSDVIFVGQQVQDLGILKSPVSESNRSARMAEIGQYDFTAYLRVFVYPYFQRLRQSNESLETYVTSGSLMNFKSSLASDSRYRLMHATSDFLSSGAEVNELAALMGERAAIFADGGHMGNLWFDPAKAQLKALILK